MAKGRKYADWSGLGHVTNPKALWGGVIHVDGMWEEAMCKDAVAKVRQKKNWADENIRKPPHCLQTDSHKIPRN